ncbi:MAG: hypothetical protein R3C39_00030 [Dehalococcoidia bacterium]
MRLRKRQGPRERLRRRVADSVAQVEVPQRVTETADRIAGRVQHAASDARGTLSNIELPRRQRSRRRGGLIATLLLVGAALAVGVAWWRRHHRDEEFAKLAGTPNEPFAPSAAPSSPGGQTAPVEANSNGSNHSSHEHEPVAPATPAMAVAPEPYGQAPSSPMNRGTQRSEARLASRSLLDSSTALPRFDAIKPPAPRFDPPGSYGKFAP